VGLGAGILGAIGKTGASHVPSSRLLGRALVAAGHERALGSEAHHIVAGTALRAGPARAVLRRFGIGINSAANGKFVAAAVHRSMHTSAYYQGVNEALGAATSRQQAIDILLGLGAGL
jgi:hypothetical protein